MNASLEDMWKLFRSNGIRIHIITLFNLFRSKSVRLICYDTHGAEMFGLEVIFRNK